MTTPAELSDIDQLRAANQRAYETVAQLDPRRPIRYWDGHNHGCGQATEEIVRRSFAILDAMVDLGLPTTCEHLTEGGIDFAWWNARAAGVLQCVDCTEKAEHVMVQRYNHCDRCEPNLYQSKLDPFEEGLPGLRVAGKYPRVRDRLELRARPHAVHIRARRIYDDSGAPGVLLPPIVLRYRLCKRCAELDDRTEPQPTPDEGRGAH